MLVYTAFGLLTIAALAIGQDLRISTDGSCADNTGETCLGSRWGDCCSSHGFCGGNETYCGGGCLSGFGACYTNADLISTDGSCGSNGTTCLGSIFGNCCSDTGYCGFTDSYCGDGCQSDYGSCGEDASNATVPTTVAASASPSTKSSGAAEASKTSATSLTSKASTSMSGVTTLTVSATSTSSGASVATSTAGSSAAQTPETTMTAGFKAGMAILAVGIAVIAGVLIWFFIFRQRRQSRHESVDPPKYFEKSGISATQSELEATSSQSVSEAKGPHSELSGFPISELPAENHHINQARRGHHGTYHDN